MIKKIMAASLLVFIMIKSNAQEKPLSVGLKIMNEFNLDGNTLYPGVGGQVVYRITKHSGLETGLYYSNQTQTFISSSFSGYPYMPGIFQTDIRKMVNVATALQI